MIRERKNGRKGEKLSLFFTVFLTSSAIPGGRID